MSIAHKNTGNTVTAADYNAIADACNDRVPLELTADSVINTNGHSLTVNTASGSKTGAYVISNDGIDASLTDSAIGDFGGLAQITARANGVRTIGQINGDPDNENAGLKRTLFDVTNNDVYAQYIDENGNIALYQVDHTGVWFQNQLADKWAFYDKRYHADGSEPDPQEIPDWQFIEAYIDGLFANGKATLVSGQVTVNNALVEALSRQVTLSYATHSGTLGILAALDSDIVNNTSFIIKSLNPDGTVNTADNSVVRWCVIGD